MSNQNQKNHQAAIEALKAMLQEMENDKCVGNFSFEVSLSVKLSDMDEEDEESVDVFRTYSRTIQGGEFETESVVTDIEE